MKRIASLPTRLPGWSRPQLEVRDLELVLALAAAGTTAGASSALHITQSAVSRALALAEQRIGTLLFERGARGMAPTAAGARLIEGAGRALDHLHQLEQRVTTPDAPPMRIRLVAECYTAYRWVPSAMASLRQCCPQLEVEVAIEHTRDPVRALARGEIDVALLTTGVLPRAEAASRGLIERPLLSDELVFVVASSHPLAKTKAITPEQLCEHPLISSVASPAEVTWFQRSVFGRRRPKLDLVRLPLTEAVIDAARAGMGIALLSEWMASGYLESGGLVVKRMAGTPLRRPWRIAYRREVDTAAQRLIAVLASAPPRLYAAVER